MKKKKILGTIYIFLLLFVITACGTQSLGNTYVEGSDYQYMFNTATYNFWQIKARGEKGYFFLRNHYLYYLDDATQQLQPLCNKVDCLHNRETDESQYEKCNAYMEACYGSYEQTGISYCNGYLYFIDCQWINSQCVKRLYRIKEDGSQKEMLYEWDTSEDDIQQWCIHRDTFYFVDHKYLVENGTIEKYYVKKLPLTGSSAYKEEILYESNEDVTVYSLAYIEAYGNYIYFEDCGSTLKDTSIITDENYLEYTYHHRMTYNIETGELKEIKFSKEDNEVYWIQKITFWKDKLIFIPSNPENGYDTNCSIYIADLDGSNMEILLEGIKKGIICFSDGKYLYLSNAVRVIRGVEDTQYYTVYDENLNVIDTFGMPFENSGDVDISCSEKLYYFLTNEMKTGEILYCFDKSTIGTYQGEAFEGVPVAEHFFSKEALQEIKED